MANSLFEQMCRDINLVDRYVKLSEKHMCDLNETFENPDIETVISIISKLGYDSKYNKREKFYSIKLVEGNYQIGYNISLKYGLVELILFVYSNGKFIFGDTFSMIISSLTGESELVKDPRFQNYDELEVILYEAFQILEDLKDSIVKEI